MRPASAALNPWQRSAGPRRGATRGSAYARGGVGYPPRYWLTGLGVDDLDELLVLADGIEVRVAAGLGPVGRAGRDRRAQRLEGAGGVPGPGRGGGETVEDVLVLGVDLGRLPEGFQRLFVLAPVVEVDAVVEKVLEALGTERGPLGLADRPLAEGPVRPRPLEELALIGVARDEGVEVVPCALVVALADRFERLLVELERGVRGPAYGRG